MRFTRHDRPLRTPARTRPKWVVFIAGSRAVNRNRVKFQPGRFRASDFSMKTKDLRLVARLATDLLPSKSVGGKVCAVSRCWDWDSLCCWGRCCLLPPRQESTRPRAPWCSLPIATMVTTIAIATTAAGAIGTATTGVAGSTTTDDIVATATTTGGSSSLDTSRHLGEGSVSVLWIARPGGQLPGPAEAIEV